MHEARSSSGGSSSGGGRSWQSGFISVAGDGAREVIDSFNPVSIAKNIKALIADPPDVKTFFKSIVTSFTHADDFKAAYDAWKSGDEYAFGKAVGKLVVELSGDLAGLLLGGTKAVTTLTRALKGATGSKRSGPSCALKSFSGDTPAVMADGSLKRIDQVHIGDLVKTRDPITGKTSVRPVTATWVHSDSLVTATFTAVHHQGQSSGRHARHAGDGGFSTTETSSRAAVRLLTTGDHPYWNDTSGSYEELRDFEVGDRVSATAELALAKIRGAEHGRAVVYNLTVAKEHTYLVGSAQILVHNCGAEGDIDPKDVRFSQDTVTQTFSDGHTIGETAEALRSGALDPSDLPTVRLTEIDGEMVTLDNRRLAAFKEAGVRMPYRRAGADEVSRESYKFNNQDGGRSVQYALWGPFKFRNSGS